MECLPSGIEQSYRRGYVQGFLEAVRLAIDGAPLNALNHFGYGQLWRWRFEPKMKPKLPPQLRQKRKAKP